MAGALEEEEISRKKKEEMSRKRHERMVALMDKSSEEEFWYPNQDKSQHNLGWNPHDYFSDSIWDSDEITSISNMYLTDVDPSNRDSNTRDSLQIVSIEVASIGGGLSWPLDVFGMVTVRDVLEIDRKRNIIFARARTNSQTITQEHPYLALTGPIRAVVTCIDPGNIEIALIAKGSTESDDRELSFLVLTLQSSMYCSFHHKDYTSKRSTLRLGFHHINKVVEATICMRLTCDSSLPPLVGFQGVLTASTASIKDAEVMLLDFRDGNLPITSNGMINLSRRVVSVRPSQKDQLKISVMTRCDEEDEEDARRDNIVFTPKTHGRSCGLLDVGTCKMQVTVAWSLFDY